MPIDSSIYFQQQAPDILGSYQKGLSMRDMINKQQMEQDAYAKQKSIEQAYAGGVKQNADGTLSMDPNSTTGNLLAKGYGQEAYQFQQMQQQQQAALQKQKMEAAQKQSEFIWNAKKNIDSETDPIKQNNIYQAHLAMGKQMGLDTSNMPSQYDDVAKQKLAVLGSIAIPAKDQDQHAIEIQKNNTAEKDRVNRLAAQNDARSERNDLNADKRDDKDAQKLDEHLSKGWTARSGAAGTVQQKIIAGEAANVLFDQGKKQEGGLDHRQVEEAAQSVARLLGGGASASARVDALVPKTLWGNVQSFNEWISNKPKGADLQAFTDRLEETAKREIALAEKQKKQFQIEGLVAHEGLRNRNPERYQRELAAKGIAPEMIDKNGRYADPNSINTNELNSSPNQSPVKGIDFNKLKDDELTALYNKAKGGK